MALIVTLTELPALTMRFEVLGVDYSPESVVTRHPVEAGGEVSDHVQKLPVAFVVRTMVTNSPSLVPAVGIAVDQAVLFLEQIEGKLLSVTIEGDGAWTNMVLTRWPHSRTNLEGRAFDLAFVQVRIALGVAVVIPPRMPAPVARVGLPDPLDAGQQAPVPAVPTSTLFEASEVGADLGGSAAAALGAMFGF